MELKVSRKTTIKELKRQFSKKFSFLKLEFFYQPHDPEEGSALRQKIADNELLSNITPIENEEFFRFQPSITVAEFEQRMQKEFSLPVQVFRKAGDIWLETIQTDSLSLEKQNSMGEASSKPMHFNINSLFL